MEANRKKLESKRIFFRLPIPSSRSLLWRPPSWSASTGWCWLTRTLPASNPTRTVTLRSSSHISAWSRLFRTLSPTPFLFLLHSVFFVSVTLSSLFSSPFFSRSLSISLSQQHFFSSSLYSLSLFTWMNILYVLLETYELYKRWTNSRFWWR